MTNKHSVKVCHITSAHNRYDNRIFHKECKSLFGNNYDVSLIVNDDFEDEVVEGVKIVSTQKKPKNRFDRMILSQRRIKKIAIRLDADIYHLHDSELLSIVSFLKKKNKIVVFDSHEDYLYAIDDKKYIPKGFRGVVKLIYSAYEKHIISKADAAIVCYHWTEERFQKYCNKVSMVLNFPIVDNNEKISPVDFNNRSVAFAGLISEIWCHKQVIEACSTLGNVKYELAGNLSGSYGDELKSMNGWQLVNYHGVLSTKDVYEKVYSKSSIGIALLDYISLCNGKVGNLSNTKIFEMMYSGLPLVCTDFHLWKEVVEKANCGIVVNPHNNKEVSSAIEMLLSSPDLAKKMGQNGKNAVVEKYNWSVCEKELFGVYDYLVKKGGLCND